MGNIPFTPNITARDPGKDWQSTFGRNLPLTLSVLGSRARITDGTPIVSIPISVKLLGSNGKAIGTIMNITAINKL